MDKYLIKVHPIQKGLDEIKFYIFQSVPFVGNLLESLQPDPDLIKTYLKNVSIGMVLNITSQKINFELSPIQVFECQDSTNVDYYTCCLQLQKFYQTQPICKNICLFGDDQLKSYSLLIAYCHYNDADSSVRDNVKKYLCRFFFLRIFKFLRKLKENYKILRESQISFLGMVKSQDNKLTYKVKFNVHLSLSKDNLQFANQIFYLHKILKYWTQTINLNQIVQIYRYKIYKDNHNLKKMYIINNYNSVFLEICKQFNLMEIIVKIQFPSQIILIDQSPSHFTLKERLGGINEKCHYQNNFFYQNNKMLNQKLCYYLFCKIDNNKLNEVYIYNPEHYSNHQINNIVEEKGIQFIVNYQDINISIDSNIEVNIFNSIPETIQKIQIFQNRRVNPFNILFIPKRDETLQVYKILFIYCHLESISLPDVIRKGQELWNFQDECSRTLQDQDIVQDSQLQGKSVHQNISTVQSYSEEMKSNQKNQEVRQNLEVFPQLIPKEFIINKLFGRKASLN